MIVQNLRSTQGYFEVDAVPDPLLSRSKPSKRKTRRSRSRNLLSGDPNFNQQWYLLNTGQTGGTPGMDLNVTNVWSEYTGGGIKIGVIDDGVEYTHPELQNNYSTSIDYDAGQQDSDAAPVYSSSYYGSDDHGTAVAGIIAARANNGIGGKGVAYNASIAGIRLDFTSASGIGQEVLAFQRATEFDVVNNSWSYTSAFADNFSSPAFRSAGLALQKTAQSGRRGLGTVVVFAAGNGRQAYENANYHNYQNSRFTISVAALTHTGVYTSYSTPGANLLVSAFGGSLSQVGDSIFTTDRQNQRGYATSDYTSTFGGTSAAAPMVSGVVALMLEANPNLGYRDVQEILAYSARQTDANHLSWQINGAKNWNGGGLHTSADYGFGLVDAQAAVRLAETWEVQSTFANERVVTAQSSPNLAIPDASSAVSDSVTVSTGLKIDRVEVAVDIDHSWIGDLQISLVSPDGTQSLLLDRPAQANAWSTVPGSLAQEDLRFTFSSSQFWGETGVGTWQLIVRDLQPNDVGVVRNWSLKLYGDEITDNDTYIYTNEWANLTDPNRQILADTFGIDTLNAAAITSDSTINLIPESTSTLAGKVLSITGTIENALTGIGNDVVVGNEVQNVLAGGRGQDALDGRAGDDQLRGDKGDDTLIGGQGNDLLVGHFGTDSLTGGDGQDTFLFGGGLKGGKGFRTAQMGVDTVVDFVSGLDKIMLNKTTFSSLDSLAGNGFSLAGEFATVSTDAAARTSAARIVYNQTNGRLFYNANGKSAMPTENQRA
jgi:subtilisin-like proprotein convertase family protein